MELDEFVPEKLVCPYRRLVIAKVFSKLRSEEFMDCYGHRCPYYYEYQDKGCCEKAERGDKV